MNCDVLVHECTLDDDLISESTFRGHSSPTMVGKFANTVKPKILLINHVSAKFALCLDEVKTLIQVKSENQIRNNAQILG